MGKVAVEEHFVCPEHEEYVSKAWMSPEMHRKMIARLSDVGDHRIGEMDGAGIDVAVLSLVTEGVQAEPDAARAAAKASRANDVLAEIIERHPTRFSGLAAVALRDVDVAIKELERSVRDLGLVGVCVNGFTTVAGGGEYYDDPKFLPFWQRLSELGVPLYLHPRYPLPSQRGIYEGRPELLGSTWGFGVETATHALRLITSGLFDRVPGATVILGHLGETLPFALHRMQGRMKALRGAALAKPVTQYLQENFYVATSGNFHTPTLIGALLELGSARVLFAVDYPFEEMSDAASWFDHVPIAPADRERISAGNARRLLKLGQ
ncbi:MAG: amidohydrolase family protein [Acidimicrobiales bacterium]